VNPLKTMLVFLNKRSSPRGTDPAPLLLRGVATATLLASSGVTPPSATWSQPIVISDTPSPAVSIITVHSDTDTEDERKYHPAR